MDQQHQYLMGSVYGKDAMNHLAFQIMLLVFLLAFIIYIFRLRTQLIDRLVFLILAVIGLVLAFRPDLSTWIASRVSIGRGTDLVFYLFIIAGLFFALTITTRTRNLQRQLTLIVRQMALDHPIQQAEEGTAAQTSTSNGKG